MHKAHLQLQNNHLREAVEAFDCAIGLLRVKQELEETVSMREAAAAQVALLDAHPEIYQPALDRQRAQAQMMMQMQQGQ